MVSEEEDGDEELITPVAKKEKKEKGSEDCLKVKELVRSDSFWEQSIEVQAVVKPIMVALRYSDSERSLMGFVWPMMLTLERQMSKLASKDYEGDMPQAQRDAVLQAVKDRWCYLHSPLHSISYVLNPRYVGMAHLDDGEVKEDFEAVLTEMLPTLTDVSEALDEYHEYHDKKGRFANKPLLWVRASKVSPAEWWLRDAPKLKWLNEVASRVLSLNHAAGGCERNWSTHGLLNGKLSQSQKASTLEQRTRLHRNMRLRDRIIGRGQVAKKINDGVPKAYPLEGLDWSSCDESNDEATWDAVTAPYGFSGSDKRAPAGS